METNIFEVASRKKLIFASTKGPIRTDDLWDLSLVQLNKLYQEQKKIESETVTDSLLGAQTSAQTDTELRIAIIKRIFDVKKAEQDAREQRVANEAKRQKIINILERKQDASLEAMSPDDLKKMLESL